MPQYLFQSLDDESVHTDIFFTFKDAPKIGTVISYEGKQWKRRPTLPQAASCTQLSPYDSKAFVEKTGQMKGTWGQMEELSAELSEKRAAANGGRDEVREKFYETSKKTTGLEHPDVRKRKAKEELAKKGVILE